MMIDSKWLMIDSKWLMVIVMVFVIVFAFVAWHFILKWFFNAKIRKGNIDYGYYNYIIDCKPASNEDIESLDAFCDVLGLESHVEHD